MEKWAIELEECIELAEVAEESALVELAVFGYAEPWLYGEPDLNEGDVWFEDRYLTDEEWEAWDAATDDIPGFFELDMST